MALMDQSHVALNPAAGFGIESCSRVLDFRSNKRVSFYQSDQVSKCQSGRKSRTLHRPPSNLPNHRPVQAMEYRAARFEAETRSLH